MNVVIILLYIYIYIHIDYIYIHIYTRLLCLYSSCPLPPEIEVLETETYRTYIYI